MTDADPGDVHKRKRRRTHPWSEREPRERRRCAPRVETESGDEEVPETPQLTEILARHMTFVEEQNMLAVQNMQAVSESAAEEVGSSQDVTKEEKRRLDGPDDSEVVVTTQLPCAFNFQLPFSLPSVSPFVPGEQQRIVEPQYSDYKVVADQLLDQLARVKSGESVNFPLIEFVRTQDQSQRKACALRAAGQALLEQAKAHERLGTAIDDAYQLLASIAINREVGQGPQTPQHEPTVPMVAVAASPEAEVGDGQEAETEEDRRLRLVQEALHSVPSTHSQRRGEKRRERKEAATMLKCDSESRQL